MHLIRLIKHIIILTHLIFFNDIQVFSKVCTLSLKCGLFYDLAHGFGVLGLLFDFNFFLTSPKHRLHLSLFLNQKLTRSFDTLILPHILKLLFKRLVNKVWRLHRFLLLFFVILLIGLIVFLRQLFPLHLSTVAVLISLSKVTAELVLLLLHLLFIVHSGLDSRARVHVAVNISINNLLIRLLFLVKIRQCLFALVAEPMSDNFSGVSLLIVFDK